MPGEKRELIVAIDFGTTYSGFAFAPIHSIEQTDISVFRGWGRGQGFSFFKTPTCVLLTPEGDFYKFGHAAVETYAKHLARNEGKDLLYFDRFKFVLYNSKDLNQDTRLQAANGRKVRALDLFAVCLEYLRQTAMETMNSSRQSQNGKEPTTKFKASQIQWVLTVPAIWNPTAKEFMREAAYMAGLASRDDPDQLLIALEPEAASFYCRSLQKKDFLGETGEQLVSEMLRKTSNSYMVIDNGGGTLDITAHQIQRDGTIKEIHQPTGGELGGVLVDKEFVALLQKIFGEDFIHLFQRDYPNDWHKIMNDFEIQKRAEQGIDSDEVSIVLPFNFVNSYSKVIGSDENINENLRLYYTNGEVALGGGYLYIDFSILEKFYQPVIQKTIEMVKAILENEKLSDAKTMFLVGGFSQAQPLRKAIVEAFPQFEVFTPRECELAIMKGAVMFAQNPNLLNSRIMGKSYGIDINEQFHPNKHPEDKKTSINGIEFCEDIFDALVKKNEEIKVGEKRTFFFSPVHPKQTVARLKFFSTSKPDASFITDPDVEAENIEFEVISPDVTKGLDRKIELNVYFGGTEIKVSAMDVSSGSSARASLRLITRG